MVVDAKILIVEDEGITALEIQNKVESWDMMLWMLFLLGGCS